MSEIPKVTDLKEHKGIAGQFSVTVTGRIQGSGVTQMSKTDTDVIVSLYRARFGYPHGPTFDCGGRKAWILEDKISEERLTRRRRHTVMAEYLAMDSAQDVTGEIRALYKGFSERDPEFEAVLLRWDWETGGQGILIIQQVKR